MVWLGDGSIAEGSNTKEGCLDLLLLDSGEPGKLLELGSE